MKKKLINSQMTSYKTYLMVLDDMIELAENVYLIKDVPLNIDIGFVNKCLLKNGSIAWFYDEVLGLLALPYDVIDGYDVYGRPNIIMTRGFNGRYFRQLNKDEFVIMYDNSRRKSLMWKIQQRAERIAMCIRTNDVNIFQQRTPRVWKTSQDKKKTLEDLINDVDGMMENVLAYDNLELDDVNTVLAPAPYVVDKIDLHLEKEWASFYRLIGITSIVEEKKERLITDEVKMGQGGTVASRYNRYEPRRKAIEEINKKWGTKMSIEYYDGIPQSDKKNESEGDEDVSIS